MARTLKDRHGDAEEVIQNFRAACQEGVVEAEIELILFETEQDKKPDAQTIDRLYALGRQGETRAVILLSKLYCDGSLTGLSPKQLTEIFTKDVTDYSGSVDRARAKLCALGLGRPKDLDRALENLSNAIVINPFALRDRGVILLELGRQEEAIQDLLLAAKRGAVWSLFDLANVQGMKTNAKFVRMLSEMEEDKANGALCAAIRNRLESAELPKSSDDEIEELLSGAVAPAAPQSRPKVMALLTARNCGSQIDHTLEHFAKQDIPVLFTDHGSTDDTWQRAMAFRDKSVVGMFRENYLGYFDLTRQLHLKRDLIQQLDCDWIVHSDADEFVETYDGTSLHDFLRRYQGTRAVALACDEFAFMPTEEEEVHDPETFPDTMRDYVCLIERDPKQRVFRRDCPLDLWLETGGHTVTHDPSELAAEPLRLRHYIGLSLDHLRAQYLPRVFSGADRTKSWHGGRFGAGNFIRPSDKSAFRNVDRDAWVSTLGVPSLPILATAEPQTNIVAPSKPLSDETRLVIVGADPDAALAVVDRLTDVLPRSAITNLDADSDAHHAVGQTPVLHVISLPTSTRRSDAVAWIRAVASIRQIFLTGARRYTEIRIEDVEGNPEIAQTLIMRLLAQPALPVRAFHRFPVISNRPIGSDLRDIGADLLRDLGYLPTLAIH